MATSETATPNKVSRPNPYIGTHDGRFHCDDVTACYMLKTMDRFQDHEIVRTRDPEKLAHADIIVDVGGELDLEKLRLDHHQRTFNQTIKDYHPSMKVTNPKAPVRLSSSGLVYSIFGKDYITKQLGLGKVYDDIKSNEKTRQMVDIIYEKAYMDIFEEIDAIDNGVDIVADPNAVYNYHINSGISNRVGRCNPVNKDATPEERLENFHKAMKMVGEEISEMIKHMAEIWWPKREKFREFVMKRKEVDESGQIMMTDNEFAASYRSLLYDLEEELGIQEQIKFIIYNDGSQWRAGAVSVDPKSFKCRVPLKYEWCGKRDEDLRIACGIPDANFVHMNGFTGGCSTLEGVKSMIRKTLGME